MLILTRKYGERIKINDDITITLLSMKEGRARIGIDAPKDVIILREEVYERDMNKRKKEMDKTDNENEDRGDK